MPEYSNVSKISGITSKETVKSSSNKFKLAVIFMMVAILFVLSTQYYERKAVNEKTEMLKSLNDSLGNIDFYASETTTRFERQLNNVTDTCKTEGVCDINTAVTGSALYYATSSATSSFESTKIITKDAKKRLENENISSSCAFAKMNSVSITSTFLLAENMGGAAKLVKKQSDLNFYLIVHFNTSNLKNDSASIDYIKTKVSEEETKMIKSHLEEIQQNYTRLNDSKMKAFSKLIRENSRSGINKYGTVDKLENYFCGTSTASQVETYHKEFIEYAYTQFDSLLKAGRYEDALPYANIIDGFLSQDTQTG